MASKETLLQQHAKLSDVRQWLMAKIRDTDDEQSRAALFEAMKAIGFALIYVEEVEFLSHRTDNTNIPYQYPSVLDNY
ncbi:hypothetical protein [Microcoleus sp. Pol11C2]|uniref:hypothetical protein n=1 Tax=Microcoleus sp. Pol11C2 TaxID=3055389 RepID=UPI002FCFD19C